MVAKLIKLNNRDSSNVRKQSTIMHTNVCFCALKQNTIELYGYYIYIQIIVIIHSDIAVINLMSSFYRLHHVD